MSYISGQERWFNMSGLRWKHYLMPWKDPSRASCPVRIEPKPGTGTPIRRKHVKTLIDSIE